MSKKTANAKGAKGKAPGKVIAPRAKPAAVVAHAAAREESVSLGKRRSFSSIDRLPEATRDLLFERLADPAFTYRDIQDFVLIETTPDELRAKATEMLDAAHQRVFGRPRAPEGSGDGGSGGENGERGADREMVKTYERERRGVHGWARDQARARGLAPPALLSDDALSRAYASFVRVSADLNRHAKMFRAMVESAGDGATMAMAESTAGLLILKVQDALQKATTVKKMQGLEKLLGSAAQWYKALVAGEKVKQTRAHLVAQVHRHYVEIVRAEFESDPELKERLLAILARAKEGATQ